MDVRRELDTRSLKFLTGGGDDEEVESLFRRLTLNGRATRLEHLALFISPSLSWNSVFCLVQYASSRYSPNLISLTVNFPFIPPIEHLLSLRELTIDIRDIGSHFVVRRDVGAKVGGYPTLVTTSQGPSTQLSCGTVDRPCFSSPWTFPGSGSSLQKLTILADPNTIPDSLYVTFPSDGRLSNLRSLVYRGPVRCLDFNGSDLPGCFPVLEELEIVGKDISLASVTAELTFPPSLTKLKLWLTHSFRQNLDFASQVPNLVELSILHEQPFIDSPWSGPVPMRNSIPWDINKLLLLSNLAQLQIASRPFKYTNIHDEFLLQLATMSTLPPLQTIDIRLLDVSPVTVASLAKAFPESHILSKGYERIIVERQEDRDFGRNAPLWPRDTPAHSGPIGNLVSCTFCSAGVGSLVMDDHLSICLQNPLLPCVMQSFGCRFVGDRIQRYEHHKKCSFYSHSCLHCLDVVGNEEILLHYSSHNTVSSRIQRPQLSYSQWKGREFKRTTCPACNMVFESVEEVVAGHTCPEATKRIEVFPVEMLMQSDAFKRKIKRRQELADPAP